MNHPAAIQTIPERCRVCYTCVRECPAKAIRILEGQAQIIAERCIGCGNCVMVCSQGAKVVASPAGEVSELLAGPEPVAALVAPSFPAEFPNLEPSQMVGMLRALGFDHAYEVAFGADLVAQAFRRLMLGKSRRRWISTSCPAVVGYVQRYHPELVGNLAPLVSPMIAMARVVRRQQREACRVVFIGPCIAKKLEAADPLLAGEIDQVLTFAELRTMLSERGISPTRVARHEFEPPLGGLGGLFPIDRGMLQAGGLEENLVESRVVTTCGRDEMVEALQEFQTGALDVRLLEMLCCKGCIAGPGMTRHTTRFERRSRVSRHVRGRMEQLDAGAWRRDMEAAAEVDLRREFTASDQRIPEPSAAELAAILERLGKLRPEDELNCGACGYDTCAEHAIAIFKGLAEDEMCLPQTIQRLRRTYEELAASSIRLAEAQAALTQAEKLASMGQLAAGIAHEVNNPLGVVLMYAHLLVEALEGDAAHQADARMIAEQADRCKKIVSGLLDFARQNKVDRQLTDLNDLLAHGLEAMVWPGGIERRFEPGDGPMTVAVDRDQVLQILHNLAGNALAAMPGGGQLIVRTFACNGSVGFSVADTGTGIPAEIRERIFDPFFTTKAQGQGTGLGLAVTYGIVKMHRGEIGLETNDDPAAGPTGTTFTVCFACESMEAPVGGAPLAAPELP